MFCEKCGKEISEGSLFCQSCGAKVEEAVAPAESVQSAPSSTPPRPTFTAPGSNQNPLRPTFTPPSFSAPKAAAAQRVDYRDYSKLSKGLLAFPIVTLILSFGIMFFGMIWSGIGYQEPCIPLQIILGLLAMANAGVLFFSLSKKQSAFLKNYLSASVVLSVIAFVILITSAASGGGTGNERVFFNNMRFGISLAVLLGLGIAWLVYGLKSRILRTYMGNNDYLDEFPLFKKSARPQSIKPELDEQRQRSSVLNPLLKKVALGVAVVLLLGSVLSTVHDVGRVGIEGWSERWYVMKWDTTLYKFTTESYYSEYDLNTSSPWNIHGTSFESSFNAELVYSYGNEKSEFSGKKFSDWATDAEKTKAASLYKKAEGSWTVGGYKNCLADYKSLYETIASRIEADYEDERKAAEAKAAADKKAADEAAAQAAEAERQKQERLSKAIKTSISESYKSGNDNYSVSGNAYVWSARRGSDTSSVPYEFATYSTSAKKLPAHNENDLIIPFEVELTVSGSNSLFSSGSKYLTISASSGGSYSSGLRFNFYYSGSGSSGWNTEQSSKSCTWTSNSTSSYTTSNKGTVQGYIVVSNYYGNYSTYTLPSSFNLEVQVGYYIDKTISVKLPSVSR
jgi:hypothetical protein